MCLNIEIECIRAENSNYCVGHIGHFLHVSVSLPNLFGAGSWGKVVWLPVVKVVSASWLQHSPFTV